MSTNTNKLKYGHVSLNKNFFSLSWRENLQVDEYHQIMVVSIDRNVHEMKMELLVHDLKYEKAIADVVNEINYYLFELKNPDPISYLIYHSQNALANVYSTVRFTYVENISKNNILLYLITRCKQLCIYNDSYATDIQKKLVAYQILKLFNYNIDLNHPSKFNQNFNELLEIINNKLPVHDNFDLNTNFTVFEFSRWLASLDSYQFANMLNYFKKIKLIKTGDILKFIEVYDHTKSEFQTSKTSG